MQVAAILPQGCVGSVGARPYQLLLAQCLQVLPAYREYYLNLAEWYPRTQFILDSGASEGETQTSEALMELGRALLNFAPDTTIVAQDILWDYQGTVEATKKSLDLYHRDWGGKTMVIPQGAHEGKRNWRNCVRALASESFDIWGVTRGADLAFPKEGGRMNFVKFIVDTDPYHRPIHLLGIWDDPWEIYQYSTSDISSRILGVDSKIFYKMARDRVKLLVEGSAQYGRPLFRTDLAEGDRLSHLGLEILKWNLRVADAWAQGEILDVKK